MSPNPVKTFVIAALIAGVQLSGVQAADEEAACAACRHAERHCRTGCPQSVSCLAVPSNTRFYGTYYVGGGTLFPGGQPRYVNEGTFGWDYGGILFPKQIALSWSHGRRYQGGSGSYRTDGPSPLGTQ